MRLITALKLKSAYNLQHCCEIAFHTVTTQTFSFQVLNKGQLQYRRFVLPFHSLHQDM